LFPRFTAPSVDAVLFLVERYLPGLTTKELEEGRSRLIAAIEDLAAHGVRVSYLGSTFIPSEESCFCRFEGASADDIRWACERANLPFARIHEARDFSSIRRRNACEDSAS
jgi:hypothetical protein